MVGLMVCARIGVVVAAGLRRVRPQSLGARGLDGHRDR